MAIIITSADTGYFIYNDISYARIYQPLKQGENGVGVYNVNDMRQQLVDANHFSAYTVNGLSYTSQSETILALLDVVYQAPEQQVSGLQISNWNDAYDNTIVNASITGTTSKTLTLEQRDGGLLQSIFTDLTGATATFVDNNDFTTGASFNTSTGELIFTRYSGDTYSVDISSYSGGTFTDDFTTGATFNSSNGILEFTRQSGDTYNVDLDGRYLSISGFTSYTGSTSSIDTTGTPVNNQVTIFHDEDTLKGDSDLTFDPSNSSLTVGGGTFSQVLNDDDNLTFIDNPLGGHFTNGTGTDTGYLVIQSPHLVGNNYTNYSLTIQIASQFRSPMQLYISARWLTTAFDQVYAYSIDSDGVNHTVRVGNDGTNIYFIIGDADTEWNRITAKIKDVAIGYVYKPIDVFKEGWDMSIDSSLPVGFTENKSQTSVDIFKTTLGFSENPEGILTVNAWNTIATGNTLSYSGRILLDRLDQGLCEFSVQQSYSNTFLKLHRLSQLNDNTLQGIRITDDEKIQVKLGDTAYDDNWRIAVLDSDKNITIVEPTVASSGDTVLRSIEFTGTTYGEIHDNEITVQNDITAYSFITSGGTSSQFVKGDGTLDSNTYLTSSDDIYTTGATFDSATGIIEYTRQSGSTYSVDISAYSGGSTSAKSALIFATTGNTTGVIKAYRDEANHGDVGANAIDVSYQGAASTRGATGAYSMAWGVNTTASGYYSTASGYFSTASGYGSMVWGDVNTSSGYYSTAWGSNNTAEGTCSTVFGEYNTASSFGETNFGLYSTTGATVGNPTLWIGTDRLFNIGNGQNDSTRSNAFTIYKDGRIEAPSLALSAITGDSQIVTKEYVDANAGGGSSDAAIVSIEDYGGVADNGTTDSSAAFIEALDALIALSGGTLIIPNRGYDRFHITNNESFLIKDCSNITIEGGGKIFIDSFNGGSGAQNVAVGRGTLIKIADGTDNFTIRDLDILVDEGCLASNFINGVICQEELGSWSNVTLEKLKIYSESRPDSQTGNHGITFYRDTTNSADTATCLNLTIRDCDIKLYGQGIYGIHSLRDIDNILIDNCKVELTAFDDNSYDAYNAIAIYGDCKNFSVTNNTLYGSGHSAIAASMAENGVIAFNRVYNVSITNEAGIEVEFKEGHGTNLTEPDFQTKHVRVHNNYVEGCYWGVAVLTREVFSTGGTGFTSPLNVQITNNTVIDSESVGIIVANNISGTPDYTTRIKNVTVSDNYISAVTGITGQGIYFYDSDGGKILNNTVIGHARQLKLGRNSSIKPIGFFDIRGNEFYANAEATGQVFHVESTGDDVTILLDGNTFDGDGQGVRGMQMNAQLGNDNLVIARNNIFRNCTDGIYLNSASNIAYSSLIGNYAFDCTARGFRVSINDGIASDNISVNCTTADQFNGTSMTASGNKDL